MSKTTLPSYTQNEVRERFIAATHGTALYWADEFKREDRLNPSVNWKDPSARLAYTLTGFMHSFHVMLAGNSGSLEISLDMNAHLLSDPEATFDFNDGSLQYVSRDSKGNGDLKNVVNALAMENPVSLDGETLDFDDLLRHHWHVAVDKLVDKAVNEVGPAKHEQAMLSFVRSILDLIDNGNEFISPVQLVTSPMEENAEYFAEMGERYYDVTILNSDVPFTEAWDNYLVNGNLEG